MPLATGGPTDSTSCNFSGCERTHRFISSPVSVDKVWPAGFSSGLALLISYGSFAPPAGYSRELVYCPGILAGIVVAFRRVVGRARKGLFGIPLAKLEPIWSVGVPSRSA